MLPEVSPLRQYSWRERDQKVTRPVVSVRRRASASIHPSMSTSRVSHCWMIAATRPSALKATRAMRSSTSSLIVSRTSIPSARIAALTSPTVSCPEWKTLPRARHRRPPDRGREVLGRAGAAGGDHGDAGDLAHEPDELEVEALLGAVGVDRVDQQLARAALDRLAGPLQGVELVSVRPPCVVTTKPDSSVARRRASHRARARAPARRTGRRSRRSARAARWPRS